MSENGETSTFLPRGLGYPGRVIRRPEANPFVARITQFPGRIFCFGSAEAGTVAELQARIAPYNELRCEIGSGSGAHLIETARQNPNAACVGFEIRFKRAVRTIEKSNVAEVPNTFVVHLDARHLEKIFLPQSITALYVFFPDPWPKPKQRKHRLLDRPFLESAVRLLKSGGILEIKSDESEYFQGVRSLINEVEGLEVMHQSEDLYRSEFIAQNIQTEFERLFCSQEKPIFWLKAKRA